LLTLPDEPVPVGSKFKVAWIGPGTQGDRIRIRDPKDTKNLDTNYVDHENGEPAEMRAPETAGEFEVQYYTRGNTVLATATLTTSPVATSLTLPDEPVPVGGWI